MKRSLKRTLRFAVPALAFFVQLWRGFRPCGPEPGFMMSGAAADPWLVWSSALLAGLLVWGVLEGLLWVVDRSRRR